MWQSTGSTTDWTEPDVLTSAVFTTFSLSRRSVEKFLVKTNTFLVQKNVLGGSGQKTSWQLAVGSWPFLWGWDTVRRAELH